MNDGLTGWRQRKAMERAFRSEINSSKRDSSANLLVSRARFSVHSELLNIWQVRCRGEEAETEDGERGRKR